MNISCLVLGGSGFLGSHLCESLLRAGYRVKVLVPKGESLRNLVSILDQIEVIRLDLNAAAKIDGLWSSVDWVFHLACTTRPKTSNDNPVADIEENLLATLCVLNSCVSNDVKQFIFVSSGGTIYGPPKSIPINEDHHKAPICSYGIHKLAIEHYLNLYENNYGLNYKIARISNAYGERQSIHSGQGLVGTVLENLLMDKPVNVYGNGEFMRDYIYVADAISALLQLAETTTTYRTFNVGSGNGVSVLEVIREIESAYGNKAKLNFLPERSMDVFKNVLDISRIQTETGWKPQYSFKEGIIRTVKWRSTMDASA